MNTEVICINPLFYACLTVFKFKEKISFENYEKFVKMDCLFKRPCISSLYSWKWQHHNVGGRLVLCPKVLKALEVIRPLGEAESLEKESHLIF
jgi:hypothetical protein